MFGIKVAEVTLAVCIDALRHDFINPNDSPFLHSLRESGISTTIRGSLSYEESPMWFAGLSPQKSDKWFLYWNSPSTSPYRKLPVGNLDLSKHRRLRFIAHLLLARFYKSSYGAAPFIPLNLLKDFDFAEKKAPWEDGYVSCKTLFSILREHGKKWLYVGMPGSDQRTDAILRRYKEAISNQEFIWMHFGETDHTEHQFGPLSNERRAALSRVDSVLQEIVTDLRRRFDKVNVLAFGDHGCVEVHGTANLQDGIMKAKRRGLKFTYFLDSTVARFWFDEEFVGEELRKTIDIPGGRFLEPWEFEKYKCNFSHRKYGRLVWVAEPGIVILPNFWNGMEAPKGMHGYLPGNNDGDAIAIVNTGEKIRTSRTEASLVDIFPTILDLMQLPVPPTNEGTSMLTALSPDCK